MPQFGSSLVEVLVLVLVLMLVQVLLQVLVVDNCVHELVFAC
jgi:hypothetical protein